MGIASKKRNHKQATLLAAAIGAGALFTHFAEGASFTWTGTATSTSSNWGTTSVWSPTGTPDATGDIANLGGMVNNATGTMVVNTTSRALGTLIFSRNGSATLSNSSGAVLSLNSGILSQAPTATGRTYTITAPITLTGNNIWNIDSTNGATTLSVSSVVSDSGTRNLTKLGSGILILGNVANTYSGVTTISGGTLSINTLANGGSSSGIGDAGSLASNLIIDGGALQFTGSNDSTNRLFTLGAGGGIIEVNNGAASFNNSGAIAFTGSGERTLTLSGDDSGTFNPIIGNSGADATSLTKSGSGNWRVSGANTYSGVTTIAGGSLEVLSLANAGAASNIGSVATTSASNLLLTNDGALRFTGTSTSTNRLFSIDNSDVTIESSGSGSLSFTNTGAIGLTGTGIRSLTLRGSSSADNTFTPVLGDQGANATALTKNGASKWILAGNNTYSGATTINGGTLAYGVNNALSDTTTVVVNSGSAILDLGANRSDTIGGLSLVSGMVTGSTSSLTVNSGSYDIRSGTINTALRGSAGLTKTTIGTATITVAAGYTGATSVTAGTLVTGVSNAIPATGSVAINGSTAVFDLGNNHTLTQTQVILDGGGEITGSGTSALTLNSGSYDLRNGTVSVPLNGTAGAYKTTANTVTVTSNSGYTGKTIIRDGTLTVEGTGGNLSGTSGVAVYNGGTFKLDNSSGVSDDRLGNVDVTLSGGTFHYDGAAASTSSSRSDETMGRLILESGSSTLTLAGSSGTNQRASLNLNHATSSISRAPGSTLYFSDNADAYVNVQNYAEVNSMLGGWALYGDGTFAALSGTNTGSITAASVDNASTLTSTWTATQNVRLSGGATSTVNPSGSSITLNSLALATSGATISISSGKSLVVESGGIALATASHLFTGAGSITAGALSGYELVVHSTGPNTGTIAATIANNGANALTLTKGGTGHLRLTGANTYTGPTYIAAGTLSLAATNNNIASSSFISVQNGATLNVASISSGFRLGTNQKLKGSGSVVGNVTADAVGSTIAPGNSPGKLTFVNTLTLTTNATYEAQIGGTGTGTGTAGIDFDQILLSGSSSSVVLGSAQLKILPMPGIVIGQPYRIIAATGNATVVSSNVFKSLAANLNAGGPYTQGNVTFNIDYGYGSNGYVDVTFSAVPEPTSVSVLALGACGLLKRRRRASKR